MLDVSDKAKAFLSELLVQRAEPAHVFRPLRQAGGFKMNFEAAADGDVVFQHEETTILAVAADLADELNGTIDRQDNAEGPRLVLVRR